MADGFSVSLVNSLLTTMAGVALYAELHTGDPGSAGTSNLSSVTTRESLTWGTASGGSVATTNTPSWTNWAGSNGEVVTDLAQWSAASGGTFEFSCQLSSSVTMTTGNTLQIASITVNMPTAS